MLILSAFSRCRVSRRLGAIRQKQRFGDLGDEALGPKPGAAQSRADILDDIALA